MGEGYLILLGFALFINISGASASTGDPWGGMGAINTSTIPDPWGGIGAVGVPPSRASPLAFSSSPPRPNNSDPWGSATEPTTTSVSNDPWAAPADLPPSVSPAPAKSMSSSSSPSTVTSNACSTSFGTLPFFPYQLASASPNSKMSVLSSAAVDPFSPGDPNDVMSAFGGNGHAAGGGFGGSPLQGTVSPTMGSQQTQSPNPWDLSGLDPMSGQTDLLGNNVGMVGLLALCELKEKCKRRNGM